MANIQTVVNILPAYGRAAMTSAVLHISQGCSSACGCHFVTYRLNCNSASELVRVRTAQREFTGALLNLCKSSLERHNFS